MKIPLKANWEELNPKVPPRVYALDVKDREIVDTEFDKLHGQCRMTWTMKSTPFSYPVFVVWRTMLDGSKKDRAIVDIRGLNRITEPDIYPLPIQSEIIAAIRDCPFISTLDCASFFYQWPVDPKDRHKLTVISHRGQESFNVTVMGYKNSPALVQRHVDRILKEHQGYAKAYIDDIVVFSRTLEEHLSHLEAIFSTFRNRRISVKPTKSFLGYPTVQLLGQRVDSLGLTTTEERLRAITALKFPKTLNEWETYLGLTGWLR